MRLRLVLTAVLVAVVSVVPTWLSMQPLLRRLGSGDWQGLSAQLLVLDLVVTTGFVGVVLHFVIARPIGRNLRLQNAALPAGSRTVPRAAMSEAAIHEDRSAAKREDGVRSHLPGDGATSARQASLPTPPGDAFRTEEPGQGPFGGPVTSAPHLGHRGAALGTSIGVGHARSQDERRPAA